MHLTSASYCMRMARFNNALSAVRTYADKGLQSPANFALAAMYLDYLQYVESSALMECREVRSRLNTAATYLENSIKDSGAVQIPIVREKYMIRD